MAIEQIVGLLIQERDRLNKAIEVLGGREKRRGRPRGKPMAIETAAPAPASKKPKMSPAARKKIAAAQKKRWAAIKAAK